MTLAEKIAVAFIAFLFACFFVLLALVAIEDHTWERTKDGQDLEQLGRVPESVHSSEGADHQTLLPLAQDPWESWPVLPEAEWSGRTRERRHGR